MTCQLGTLRPAESRSVTIAGRAAGLTPAGLTPTHGDHNLDVQKREA